MKILIKFDYENKTYYVYQEDNEIKYGTNEDMKNVSLEDENIIKKVLPADLEVLFLWVSLCIIRWRSMHLYLIK